MPAPRFRHRVEHAAVATVTSLARGVPKHLALAGGRLLGRTFYALDAPRRRLAMDNLAAALPNLSPDDRRHVAKQVFEHFGGLLVELLRVSGLRPEELRAMVEVEGEERVRHALAQGRGVLFVTGHFGFWEIAGIAHALVFPPIAVVVRALDNPLLDRLLERVRTRTGNVVIERRGGLRRIMRALAANQGVAILIDQHIHTDAVVVDFFNRPAATTSAVAAIALRTGAPVIPVFAVPLPDGRYRLIYEHAVAPPPADSEDPVREFTQRCTDVLEMYVRRYPQLWLWMHRRWRHAEAESAT